MHPPYLVRTIYLSNQQAIYLSKQQAIYLSNQQASLNILQV